MLLSGKFDLSCGHEHFHSPFDHNRVLQERETDFAMLERGQSTETNLNEKWLTDMEVVYWIVCLVIPKVRKGEVHSPLYLSRL